MAKCRSDNASSTIWNIPNEANCILWPHTLPILLRGLSLFKCGTRTSTVLPACFLAIKPFLLGVKTSAFKRKPCYIESTLLHKIYHCTKLQLYNGCSFQVRHKPSINFHCFFNAKSVEAEIGTILRVKKPNCSISMI